MLSLSPRPSIPESKYISLSSSFFQSSSRSSLETDFSRFSEQFLLRRVCNVGSRQLRPLPPPFSHRLTALLIDSLVVLKVVGLARHLRQHLMSNCDITRSFSCGLLAFLFIVKASCATFHDEKRVLPLEPLSTLR